MTQVTFYDQNIPLNMLPGFSVTGGAGFATATNLAGQVVGPFAPNTLPETDAGVEIWEARTNKCTNRNWNPSALTNFNAGAPLVATLVDDAAALAASGLSALGPTVFQVYNPDISRRYVTIGGVVGNVNPHTVSIYARGGTGVLNLDNHLSPLNIPGGLTYSRYVISNIIPVNTSRALVIGVDPGETLYMIGNQLEEGSFVTPVIPVSGTAATRTALGISPPASTAPVGNITLFCDFELDVLASGATRRLIYLGLNRPGLYVNSTGGLSATIDSIVNTNTIALSRTGRHKAAASFSSGRVSLAVNGQLATTYTGTYTEGGLTVFSLGSTSGSSAFLNGKLRYIRTIPYIMSDAELQALTAL